MSQSTALAYKRSLWRHKDISLAFMRRKTHVLWPYWIKRCTAFCPIFHPIWSNLSCTVLIYCYIERRLSRHSLALSNKNGPWSAACIHTIGYLIRCHLYRTSAWMDVRKTIYSVSFSAIRTVNGSKKKHTRESASVFVCKQCFKWLEEIASILEASVYAKKKSWLYLSWPTLLKSTGQQRYYFTMIIIVFFCEGNLKKSTHVCASMFLFVNSECPSVPETDYLPFRVVEKGSTAGGAKSMTSNILLFLRKITTKSWPFTRVRVIHAKKICQKILQKPHTSHFL
jgi:hypothetical protein